MIEGLIVSVNIWLLVMHKEEKY